jgi:hypothetical protein
MLVRPAHGEMAGKKMKYHAGRCVLQCICTVVCTRMRHGRGGIAVPGLNSLREGSSWRRQSLRAPCSATALMSASRRPRRVLLSLMRFASFDALCVTSQELISKKHVSPTFSRRTSQDCSCWPVSRESLRELRARRSSGQRSLGPGTRGDAPPRVRGFIHISCHTKGYEDNVHAMPLLVRDGAA